MNEEKKQLTQTELTDKDLDASVGGNPVTVAVSSVVGALGAAAGAILDGADAAANERHIQSLIRPL